MRYYAYHKRGIPSLVEMGNSFPWLVEQKLSIESIEARYRLLVYLKEIYGFAGVLEQESSGQTLPIKLDKEIIYWSITHTENYTAYIISDSPVGIDITEKEIRDSSLFDIFAEEEYTLLSGKNWDNFYILWTMKEALIKKLGVTLDDMKHMQIHSLDKNLGIILYDNQAYSLIYQSFDDFILSYAQASSINPKIG